MNDLSTALAVLSAMITPAVLISACGSLLIATSNRLGRVIERTRKVSERFETLARSPAEKLFLHEERTVLFSQLERATRRSRLLQRAMTSLYLALSVFVATSVSIGVVAMSGQQYAWLPMALGFFGAALLFYASLLLIAESRIALLAVDDEMDFVQRIGRAYAPVEMLQRRRRRRFFRRRET